jgi:hypothetical protein
MTPLADCRPLERAFPGSRCARFAFAPMTGLAVTATLWGIDATH